MCQESKTDQDREEDNWEHDFVVFLGAFGTGKTIIMVEKDNRLGEKLVKVRESVGLAFHDEEGNQKYANLLFYDLVQKLQIVSCCCNKRKCGCEKKQCRRGKLE